MADLVVCPHCNGTGFKDKIGRGVWEPGDCQPCMSSGWVDPRTGTRTALKGDK